MPVKYAIPLCHSVELYTAPVSHNIRKIASLTGKFSLPSSHWQVLIGKFSLAL